LACHAAIRPTVSERAKAGFRVGNGTEHVEQIAGRPRQPSNRVTTSTSPASSRFISPGDNATPWAIRGRSTDKLQNVRDEIGAPVGGGVEPASFRGWRSAPALSSVRVEVIENGNFWWSASQLLTAGEVDQWRPGSVLLDDDKLDPPVRPEQGEGYRDRLQFGRLRRPRKSSDILGLAGRGSGCPGSSRGGVSEEGDATSLLVLA
jgi:hypothetical protein